MGWKMEIETDWGTFRVSDSFDSDNEIDVGIERGYKEDTSFFMSMNNVKQLIAHLQEQVDKHGTI